MPASSLSVSAQNRLIGAALLALSLMWLFLPDLGLAKSTEMLGWFLYGTVLGAGLGGLITGEPVWGLRRWISQSALRQ